MEKVTSNPMSSAPQVKPTSSSGIDSLEVGEAFDDRFNEPRVGHKQRVSRNCFEFNDC